MSVLSIFSRTKPQLGYLQFDAVLEEVTSKSITLTEFPVEFGANVTDHGVINPVRYIMTGAVSNTPLGFGLQDAAMIGTGLIGNAIGGAAGGIAQAAAAYFLAGSEETRAASAWSQLTALLEAREPIEVQSGLELLLNMCITRLDTRRVPETEDGLIFIAELREVIFVSTNLVNLPVESQEQLPANDPVSTQASPELVRGKVGITPQ